MLDLLNSALLEYESNPPPPELFWLPRQQFVNTVKLIFDTTYIKHKQRFYLQISGTPMGGLFSTHVTLNVLDNKILSKYQSAMLFWGRYVDDIGTCASVNAEQNIFADLNSFHPSLQFTSEQPDSSGNITFLDLKITLEQGKLQTTHHIKPTQTTRTIQYTSHQPLHIKKATLQGELLRSLQHSSTNNAADEQILIIKQTYLDNQYPNNLINSTISTVQHQLNHPTMMTKNQPPFRHPIPYLKGTTEKICSLLRCYNIATFHPVQRNLQTCWSPHIVPKVHTVPNTVYKIPCQQCTKYYIGTSGRPLHRRITEHEACVRRSDPKNSLALHHINTQHSPDFTNISILAQDPHKFSRLKLESLYIQLHKNNILNHQELDNSTAADWSRIMLQVAPKLRP